MNDKRNSGMLDATRLTRSGRLVEATALLQRLLRGKAANDEPSAGGAPNVSRLRLAQIGAPSDRPSLEKSSHASQKSCSQKSWRTVWQAEKPSPGPAEDTAKKAKRPAKAGESQMPVALRGFLDLFDRIGAETATPSPFGETALFEETRPMPRAKPAPRPDSVRSGGQFIKASYSNHAGSRDYKLYIPSGYRGKPLPLIVMLHGCKQSPDDFAAGTRMNMLAEERTSFVAYPAQAASANYARCWNWFRPGHQQRDEGEPSLIAGITLQIMRDYAVDPRRVYVAGLSAGAAAAAVMGMAYADLYAAIGVHSGLTCGAARDVFSAFAAMRRGKPANAPSRNTRDRQEGHIVPTIVFHGDRDTTVHPCNGDQVIAESTPATGTDLHAKVEHGKVQGGYAYDRTLYADARGRTVLEHWVIQGAGHAWSGGSLDGSYTDPRGPDASREMLRFFLEHRHPKVR
jgi:poly(hydroxyalkanoate) depolymerase family esterase